MIEREIKLRIADARGFRALLDALPERGLRPQTNIYFDAPSLELSASGRLVRVREEPGRLTLTLKRGARVTSGFLEAEEWEVEIDPARWGDVAAGRAPVESLAPSEIAQIAGGVSLREVARLTNRRHLREGPHGALYELDETRFPWGEIHYELEIETADPDRDLEAARALLARLGVAHDERVRTKQERLFEGLRAGRADAAGPATSSPSPRDP